MNPLDPSWLKILPLENLQAHKQALIENIRVKFPPFNNKKKTIETILSEDCDQIPKVPLAGLVVDDAETPYQIMHNGLKTIKYGYGGVYNALTMYGLKGHHEPQEEKVFYEVLQHIQPGSTMIEFGAAWGYYSLWFSQAIPHARSILVEPVYEDLCAGMKNFSLNQKEATFIQGYIGNPEPAAPGAHRIEFDPWIRGLGIDHVHILHSDIQGFEHELLVSAQQSLASGMIDYLFISTHHESIRLFCLNFLEKIGYKIIATHSAPESLSADGLIVAKHRDVAGPDFVPITIKNTPSLLSIAGRMQLCNRYTDQI